MARVFVAMSGGVDSSVAAALLMEQKHDVTGVTMQLWQSGDEEGGCCSVSAVRDARRVCDLLGIPHYTLNFRESFDRSVVEPFADAYAAGRTPNPCIVCNDVVKFADLLGRVSAQGADYLATGHYARIVSESAGEPRLARGMDPDKDQSYFLYRMTPAHLEHVVFPVGELHKSEVRAFAERFGLPVAKKAESQEVCFAAAGKHAELVRERRPESGVPGDIVSLEGEALGRHTGIADYTVGQRKGLGIGGSADPLYVVGIDAQTNRVVVGPRSALAVRAVTASNVVWNDTGTDDDFTAVVRYRMEPRHARVARDQDELSVTFDEPIEGVARGQAVVCYQGDVVVGGGVIECTS